MNLKPIIIIEDYLIPAPPPPPSPPPALDMGAGADAFEAALLCQ